MTAALVGQLPAGPLDIVGDVHGEISALEALLGALGYAADGSHPADRRLIFLGDLVDRGPDSPAVLDKVQALVAAGRAQCLLGNHELNLLRDVEKHGNGWWVKPEQSPRHPARPLNPGDKPRFMAFLESLPLVLEREDLRVVHACWHDAAVADLHSANSGALALFTHHQARLREEWAQSGLWDSYIEEWRTHGRRLSQRHPSPDFLPAMAAIDSHSQMDNPVAVLTSGAEQPAPAPVWAGGRWRMVERVTWWDQYDQAVPVVIGHYWRRYSDAGKALMDEHGPDVFAGVEPHQWMGKGRNVYCVDFSVGGRYVERAAGVPDFQCRLAALRVPEWTVVHDDGETWQIGPPG